jgi:hypothetical protein
MESNVAIDFQGEHIEVDCCYSSVAVARLELELIIREYSALHFQLLSCTRDHSPLHWRYLSTYFYLVTRGDSRGRMAMADSDVMKGEDRYHFGDTTMEDVNKTATAN